MIMLDSTEASEDDVEHWVTLWLIYLFMLILSILCLLILVNENIDRHPDGSVLWLIHHVDLHIISLSWITLPALRPSEDEFVVKAVIVIPVDVITSVFINGRIRNAYFQEP